jgi:hypothetical protein
MTANPTPAPRAADEPWVEVYSSREFPGWLAEQRVSLAFTTYQTAKLFFIGLQADGHLAVGERTFNRCMPTVKHRSLLGTVGLLSAVARCRRWAASPMVRASTSVWQ